MQRVTQHARLRRTIARSVAVLGLAIGGIAASSASAATLPVVEDFSDGTSNWGNGDTTFTQVPTVAPNLSTTDPIDGNYISWTKNYAANGQAQTAFRNQGNIDSSNDAFVFNWVDAGVTSVSFYVRHTASAPTRVGLRLGDAAVSPAWAVMQNATIPANQWTLVTIPVALSDVNTTGSAGYTWTWGGSPTGTIADRYNGIFTDFSSMQVMIENPTPAAAQSFRVDFDSLAVVPEPASLGVLGFAGLALAARRRRRRM